MAQVLFGFPIDENEKGMEDVSADTFYSEENINFLTKIISDIESGKAVLTEHELLED